MDPARRADLDKMNPPINILPFTQKAYVSVSNDTYIDVLESAEDRAFENESGPGFFATLFSYIFPQRTD